MGGLAGPVSVLSRHLPHLSRKVFPFPIREFPAFDIDRKNLAGLPSERFR
jgi:hypothetical protein